MRSTTRVSPGANQIYDFALAWIYNFLRELCGAGWLPSQVLIPHAKPHEPMHYRNAFKMVPQFDSEVCAIRFPALWLEHPIEGADPGAQATGAVRRSRQGGPDLLQQVFRALRDLLLSGRSSGNDVAFALSMHRRTLNRRLQQCGTTFQCVLDEVRCEVARQLLCYSEVALDDIAASLGYAGVSPFMRSFRRWTGLSPGRLRRLSLKSRYDVNFVMIDARREERMRGRAPARPVSYQLESGVGRAAAQLTQRCTACDSHRSKRGCAGDGIPRGDSRAAGGCGVRHMR